MRGGATPALRAAVVAAVLFCPLADPGAAHAAVVNSIRSSAGADYTRVIVDLSQATSFEYALLPADPKHDKPARLYVDLRGVRLDPKKDLGLWVGDTRVRRVRTGQFDRTTARVVLELEGPVSPKVFQLATPARLVIDLRGPGSGRPAGPVVAGKPPGSAAAVKKPAAAAVPKKPTAIAPKAPAPVARAQPAPAARVSRARRVRVVIDPGHGGKDPGARGSRGETEKHTVFDISRRLADMLRRRLGVEIYMTRTIDEYIPLEERKDLANRVEADMFISIHANASKNSGLYGIETYYLKNTNDRATLRLARLENGVDMLIKGSDVSTDADLNYILSDMVQGQKEVDSILLANHIQTELVGYLRPRYQGVESLGVKQGPFMVLDGTYMPSILVEAGFITNSLEGRRLAAASYRDAIAEGLYRGIKRYLEDERVNELR